MLIWDSTAATLTCYLPPSGDEAFDLSHFGGEHEVFEDFAQEISKLAGW